MLFFFVKQKTAYELRISDWSSDVCSSDLEAAYSYRLLETHTIANVTGGPVQLVEIPGIGLTNASWAPEVRAMLAAAEADGVHLTGSSYRDADEQIALRRAHCGTSHYRSEEHTSELQSLMRISYAVFCLKKK